MRDREQLNRWRLILGKQAGAQISFEDGPPWKMASLL